MIYRFGIFWRFRTLNCSESPAALLVPRVSEFLLRTTTTQSCFARNASSTSKGEIWQDRIRVISPFLCITFRKMRTSSGVSCISFVFSFRESPKSLNWKPNSKTSTDASHMRSQSPQTWNPGWSLQVYPPQIIKSKTFKSVSKRPDTNYFQKNPWNKKNNILSSPQKNGCNLQKKIFP